MGVSPAADQETLLSPHHSLLQLLVTTSLIVSCGIDLLQYCLLKISPFPNHPLHPKLQVPDLLPDNAHQVTSTSQPTPPTAPLQDHDAISIPLRLLLPPLYLLLLLLLL